MIVDGQIARELDIDPVQSPCNNKCLTRSKGIQKAGSNNTWCVGRQPHPVVCLALKRLRKASIELYDKAEYFLAQESFIPGTVRVVGLVIPFGQRDKKLFHQGRCI